MLIDKVIIHWVPQSDSKQRIKLSESFSEVINPEFWKEKIEEAQEKKNFSPIEFIGGKPGFIGEKVRFIKGEKRQDKIISISHEIAEFLYSKQNRKNISDGFLIIIKGKNDYENEYVCLLKLEGMRGSEAKFDDSRKSYNLNDLENILLTQKTKVFKLAMFVFNGHSFIESYAMDDQVNSDEIATFWLTNFLQAKNVESPIELTKQFINFVRKFASQSRLNVGESIDLLSGLHAELISNRRTIKLSDFASEYVPPTLLEDFNNEAQKNKVPLYPIKKEFSDLTKKKSGVRKFILEEGITVTVPQQLIIDRQLAWIESKGQNRILKIIAKIIKER
ncbi:nucleoid-associated protein [Leptospira stimsonii]|uniref:Nucleoid-associated protein NdpA n=1 Tax=Leptospira stimsonii TaxID=2202203 RepID=A0ABY2MWC1_9LEPT|nr:nucleoid-associated protein [Leptospira stimsonii]TGK17592.1 nucleoid-associated protein NdpA [Leptospira stimsonii]TGM10292.1 nucleoid-associated protein NdpA [Leptospira stimsonii]